MSSFGTFRRCAGVLAFAGLVACGKGGSGGTAEKPAPPLPPSEKCGAAAANLAGFDHPGAPPDELDPAVATLETECKTLRLSDDEAQCLADASDKLAALKCPRALGPELREVEQEIGTGPCRPVMLVTHLAEIAQMRQVPEEQRQAALDTFKIVKRVLGKSCRDGHWGDEAMECFKTRDVMRGFGCIEMVPPEILQQVDSEIKAAMMAMGDGSDSGPPIASTGVAACDGYLRARRRFDQCEAVPEPTRKSLLSTLEPLEKPWRSLPPLALASTGETFTQLCETATGQLAQLATSVGCQ